METKIIKAPSSEEAAKIAILESFNADCAALIESTFEVLEVGEKTVVASAKWLCEKYTTFTSERFSKAYSQSYDKELGLYLVYVDNK